MIYEAAISYTTQNEKGVDVTRKEQYIVNDKDTFCETEVELYQMFDDLSNLDVTAIKRSKLREIVNTKEKPEQKIYFATIADFFVSDETGEVKEIRYLVALFAVDMQDAHKVVEEYMRQGLDDMELKTLKETKFADVIE